MTLYSNITYGNTFVWANHYKEFSLSLFIPISSIWHNSVHFTDRNFFYEKLISKEQLMLRANWKIRYTKLFHQPRTLIHIIYTSRSANRVYTLILTIFTIRSTNPVHSYTITHTHIHIHGIEFGISMNFFGITHLRFVICICHLHRNSAVFL